MNPANEEDQTFMNRKNKWIIYGIGLSLLLAGCMDNGVDEKSTQDEMEEQYVSVQDYKGEGYTLKGGKENDNIAEEHREEVEKAVKDFFLTQYIVQKSKFIILWAMWMGPPCLSSQPARFLSIRMLLSLLIRVIRPSNLMRFGPRKGK
jgi:hypothetical protein